MTWCCCCFLEADFSPDGVLEGGVVMKSVVFPVPPLVAIEEKEKWWWEPEKRIVCFNFKFEFVCDVKTKERRLDVLVF